MIFENEQSFYNFDEALKHVCIKIKPVRVIKILFPTLPKYSVSYYSFWDSKKIILKQSYNDYLKNKCN